MAIQRTVLTFVFGADQNLLMIWKKTGQGKGKWNVPGGKCESEESDLDAAIRETEEETGIVAHDLQPVGKLEFYFPEGNSWDNTCTVFVSNRYSGELESETEECRAEWVPLNKIPWDEMWDSDRLWVPLVLQKTKFHRVYYFDRKNSVIKEEIRCYN